MIQCVCLNPALQKTISIEKFSLNAVNRVKGAVVESSAGKGINVARALYLLGQRPAITGFCGGPTGDLLQHYLAEEGLTFDFVQTSQATRTCTTILDPIHKTHTELVEEGRPVSVDEVKSMHQVYEKNLDGCRVLTISGTAPHEVPETMYYDFVKLARQRGIPTLVDTQKALLKECLKAQPFLLKVNREEIGAIFHQPVDSPGSLYKIIDHINDEGVEWVVITQGRANTLVAHRGEYWEITPPSIQAINPIGAGDATLGGIAAAFCQGKDVLQAICFGTACGTASALTLTPGSLRVEDVNRLENMVSMKRKT